MHRFTLVYIYIYIYICIYIYIYTRVNPCISMHVAECNGVKCYRVQCDGDSFFERFV